jgi:hypothetical protein
MGSRAKTHIANDERNPTDRSAPSAPPAVSSPQRGSCVVALRDATPQESDYLNRILIWREKSLASDYVLGRSTRRR